MASSLSNQSLFEFLPAYYWHGGHEIISRYHAGYGWITRLDHYRNQAGKKATIRTTGVVRIGGDLYAKQRQALDIVIASYASRH